ncbi:MAG: 3-deoxy-manno-octulosonate cytidylyltransferase [Xanthomonadaceae bacterium]|nr:3-deoxy-manno-octulosonate cytidylyltransferase [Xanthomonadaceae bacterium]
MSKPRVVAVIPARYASTRLPGKPLADIHGKPMIQWVYERVKKCRAVDQVIVATDDTKILEKVKSFGGECLMTSLDCQSGTDRVAEVATKVDGDIFVNAQGDEPLMSSQAIELAVKLVVSGKFKMSTVATPIQGPEDLTEVSVVKVIVDADGNAIYFSRLPIPYTRVEPPKQRHSQGMTSAYLCKRHVGLYVYERATLAQFAAWPATDLEKAESLEQLRALHHGLSIGVADSDFLSIGVDTSEDLKKVRELLQ